MDPSQSTVHATPSFIWTIRRRSQLEKNHDQVLSAKYLVRSLALSKDERVAAENDRDVMMPAREGSALDFVRDGGRAMRRASGPVVGPTIVDPGILALRPTVCCARHNGAESARTEDMKTGPVSATG